MGPMFGTTMRAPLPAWVDDFAGDGPLVWVYCGNPRYQGLAGPADSIVVLRAAYDMLSDEDVRVIVAAGHQGKPEELPPPPANFRETDFLPGLTLARRCDLIVHHGGHGSCMTGAFAGTPAVIVPTYSERESNARRLAGLGVAELHIPVVDDTGEKRIDHAAFAETVRAMLADSSYRTRAEALSQRIGEYPGPEKIAERVEALL